MKQKTKDERAILDKKQLPWEFARDVNLRDLKACKKEEDFIFWINKQEAMIKFSKLLANERKKW